MPRLFVYGTFREGQSNAHLLPEGTTHEPARLAGFRLLEGRYPWIEAADGEHVVGDVVEVDEATLAGLDDLEGVDVGLYEKLTVTLEDGSSALTYVGGSIAGEAGEPVEGGDFVHLSVPDGEDTWRFERAFLASHWTCIWGRGCAGILPVEAPERGHGCCSLGADLDGADEAMLVSARAAMLSEERFQHAAAAADGGVFADGSNAATRVVDGACIFLNRPGFEGGAGCALHLEAVAGGESPIDWKPSVCWQLPLHVDWAGDVATVRGWTRADWGPEGRTMAWCCTERGGGPDAYVGDRPVVESLAEELQAIVGHEVWVELKRRL